jgi:NADPH2 dehydrogenase
MIDTPFKINASLTLKNRIVMAPMCMYQAESDGFSNHFHETHYHMHAMGGVGLVIVEATSVMPNGMISIHDLGIYKDEHIQGLKEIVKRIKSQDALAGIQINHAGRKARVENTIGPSALGYDEVSKVPKAMTLEDIKEVISSFKEAARRANEAGFDLLEIHGAHGYLISQFMSKISNKRLDRYQDKSMFLNEVIKTIYDVWPKEKAISLRVSATEYHEDGYDCDELIEILKRVDLSRIDFIHVSSGGNIKPKLIDPKPGYQLEYAKKIQQSLHIPTIGGGLLLDAKAGDDALKEGMCSLVFYGRLLLRDPFVFLRELDTLTWPKAYERGKLKKESI